MRGFDNLCGRQEDLHGHPNVIFLVGSDRCGLWRDLKFIQEKSFREHGAQAGDY